MEPGYDQYTKQFGLSEFKEMGVMCWKIFIICNACYKKSFSVDNSMLFYLNFIITSYFFFVHNMFVLLYSVIYILCCRTNRVANIFISHISKLDCSSKRTKIFGHQSISSYLVPHWWPRNSICAITICFTLWWSFYHWSTLHLH